MIVRRTLTSVDPITEVHNEYRIVLKKIQEIYRFELERIQNSEKEFSANIHHKFKEQSRVRFGFAKTSKKCLIDVDDGLLDVDDG